MHLLVLLEPQLARHVEHVVEALGALQLVRQPLHLLLEHCRGQDASVGRGRTGEAGAAVFGRRAGAGRCALDLSSSICMMAFLISVGEISCDLNFSDVLCVSLNSSCRSLSCWNTSDTCGRRGGNGTR